MVQGWLVVGTSKGPLTARIIVFSVLGLKDYIILWSDSGDQNIPCEFVIPLIHFLSFSFTVFCHTFTLLLCLLLCELSLSLHLSIYLSIK